MPGAGNCQVTCDAWVKLTPAASAVFSACFFKNDFVWSSSHSFDNKSISGSRSRTLQGRMLWFGGKKIPVFKLYDWSRWA